MLQAALKQIVSEGDPTYKERAMRVIGDFLFLILFFMLIGVWLMMWVGLQLVGGAIHLLLIVAFVALLLHLVRGRRAA